VVNLLRLLRGDLRGLYLSRLAIRQVYLQEVEAQDASLEGAHLSEAVLAEAFAYTTTVPLSADGALLAARTPTGEVRMWRVAGRTLLLTVQGHSAAVWGVALSGDGRLLASGGHDGTVRLWEVPSGQPLATLHGHTGAVSGAALSADGHLVASGGFDGTVRLWESATGHHGPDRRNRCPAYRAPGAGSDRVAAGIQRRAGHGTMGSIITCWRLYRPGKGSLRLPGVGCSHLGLIHRQYHPGGLRPEQADTAGTTERGR
jgi:hypothetical protein